MSSPDPKTDMIRSIEALLSTPAAGQAVARAAAWDTVSPRGGAPTPRPERQRAG